jgi:hypothetical protein
MDRGSIPFGGSNGLVCLFPLSRRSKYCHNGGMASAPSGCAMGSSACYACPSGVSLPYLHAV